MQPCPVLIGVALPCADWCSPAAGELLAMFKACMPVIRCDIQSARFLMPYLLQCVISTGSTHSRKGVTPPPPPPFPKDISMCCFSGGCMSAE